MKAHVGRNSGRGWPGVANLDGAPHAPFVARFCEVSNLSNMDRAENTHGLSCFLHSFYLEIRQIRQIRHSERISKKNADFPWLISVC